jgi:hypothetical protein
MKVRYVAQLIIFLALPWCLSACLFEASLEPAPIHNQATEIRDTRGMWVWDENVVLDATAQDDLFAFVSDKKVTNLYIDVLSLLRENPEALRQFIGRANQQEGVRVELLAGAPHWAKAENHFIPIALLREAIAFAQSSPLEQRPVGFQFDIEPYVIEEDWPVDEYLTLLEKLMLEAQGTNLNISVAIPFWFDIEPLQRVHNGQDLPLSHHVLSIVDQVVIMDYRDFAEKEDGIIANAATEMAFAATLGKPVIIGVETQCNLDEDEPPKVTFCEEGEMALNWELDKVRAAYRESASWGGIAIHRYTSYREIISYPCVEDNNFTIVGPPDGYHTSNRFISVQGCGGTPNEPVHIYVEVADGPHLQDKKPTPGPDGRWQVDRVILGGIPLPFEHGIYAVTKSKDGLEIRSDTITVVKEE